MIAKGDRKPTLKIINVNLSECNVKLNDNVKRVELSFHMSKGRWTGLLLSSASRLFPDSESDHLVQGNVLFPVLNHVRPLRTEFGHCPGHIDDSLVL